MIRHSFKSDTGEACCAQAFADRLDAHASIYCLLINTPLDKWAARAKCLRLQCSAHEAISKKHLSLGRWETTEPRHVCAHLLPKQKRCQEVCAAECHVTDCYISPIVKVNMCTGCVA